MGTTSSAPVGVAEQTAGGSPGFNIETFIDGITGSIQTKSAVEAVAALESFVSMTRSALERDPRADVTLYFSASGAQNV